MLTCLRVFILVSSVFLYSCSRNEECSSGIIKDEKQPHKISVRAEATLLKPADQIELVLGVESKGKDADKTVQENNKKMEGVLTVLHRAGLSKNEYQTSRYKVQPITHYPKEDDAKPVLDYYQVSNTVRIKTQKLEIAEILLSQAVEAGANVVQEVMFTLNDPLQYRNEAIRAAIERATSDANAAADAAHMQIQDVISIEVDQASSRPFPRVYSTQFKSGAPGSNIPLESGDVEVQAGVNISFEIRNQEK